MRLNKTKNLFITKRNLNNKNNSNKIIEKLCTGRYQINWSDCTGKRAFANGDLYSGKFKNGKKHGQGTLTYADGEIYKGSFKNGMYHGEGTLTSANGKVLKGIWVNDKFTSER